MIPYLLHVSLLLAVCLLFYKLLLQTETFYRLNRYTLLSCLAIAFLLPLVHIPQQWKVLQSQQPIQVTKAPMNYTLSAPIVELKTEKVDAGQSKTTTHQLKQFRLTVLPKPVQKQAVPAPAGFTWPVMATLIKWMFIIYWIGVAVFGLNLLIQLITTLYRAYAKPAIVDGRYRIIDLNGDKVPCSFLNTIFINPEKYDWDTYSQILQHEKVHVRQLHSADILLAELAIVFQWFNPFVWFYRKEVENNLEYLTDEAVIAEKNTDKSFYQLSLLKVSTPHLSLRIATNYNQSLLKKRILMMNTKKSNIHTLWKYFMLLPLFGGLACALNEPAMSHSLMAAAKPAPVTKEVIQGVSNFPDETEGYWFAAIQKDKLDLELKYKDENHNWSHSSTIPIADFSALPKEQKGDFTLKRDAGTLLLSGQFNGNQGYGNYKFTADNSYKAYLNNAGIEGLEDHDLLSFLLLNINKGYIQSLNDAGLNHLSKGQIISLAVLKVDAPFIKEWHNAGFKDITPQQLTSARVMHLDGAYAHEIQQAGYPDITFQQLSSLKVQGVTAKYINSLQKAGMPQQKSINRLASSYSQSSASSDNGHSEIGSMSSSGTTQSFSVYQVSSARVMHIDSAYIKSLADAGYGNLDFSQITSFKLQGITADYLKAFAAVGYPNLPAHTVIAFRIQGVTPEYLQAFTKIGYNNLPASAITSFKIQHVDPDFVKGFENIGFKHLEPNRIITLKIQGITPAFAKGFQDLGFTDASIIDISTMKVSGITPEYIASLKQKGIVAKNLRGYIMLKNTLEQ